MKQLAAGIFVSHVTRVFFLVNRHSRESCKVKFLDSFLAFPDEFLRMDLSRGKIKRETDGSTLERFFLQTNKRTNERTNL